MAKATVQKSTDDDEKKSRLQRFKDYLFGGNKEEKKFQEGKKAVGEIQQVLKKKPRSDSEKWLKEDDDDPFG